MTRRQKLEEEAEIAGKHDEWSKGFHEDYFRTKDLETERSANLLLYHVIYSTGDRVLDKGHGRNREIINCGTLILILFCITKYYIRTSLYICTYAYM